MRWRLIFGIFVILISVVVVLQTIIRPRPIPLLDLTPIERPEQAGVLAARTLELQLHDHKNFALAFEKTLPLEKVRQAFLQTLDAQHILVIDRDLSDIFGSGRSQNIHVQPFSIAFLQLDDKKPNCSRHQLTFDFLDPEFLPCAKNYILKKNARKRNFKSPFVTIEQFGAQTFLLFLKE